MTTYRAHTSVHSVNIQSTHMCFASGYLFAIFAERQSERKRTKWEREEICAPNALYSQPCLPTTHTVVCFDNGRKSKQNMKQVERCVRVCACPCVCKCLWYTIGQERKRWRSWHKIELHIPSLTFSVSDFFLASCSAITKWNFPAKKFTSPCFGGSDFI